MWWGTAAGLWALSRRPVLLRGPLPGFGEPLFRTLSWLGRWSLSFYLLHQPVLIGGLLGLKATGVI